MWIRQFGYANGIQRGNTMIRAENTKYWPKRHSFARKSHSTVIGDSRLLVRFDEVVG